MAKGKSQAQRMKVRAQSAENEIAAKNQEIARLREQLAARNPGPSSTSDGDSGEEEGDLRGDGDGDNEDASARSDSEEEEQDTTPEGQLVTGRLTRNVPPEICIFQRPGQHTKGEAEGHGLSPRLGGATLFSSIIVLLVTYH